MKDCLTFHVLYATMDLFMQKKKKNYIHSMFEYDRLSIRLANPR